MLYNIKNKSFLRLLNFKGVIIPIMILKWLIEDCRGIKIINSKTQGQNSKLNSQKI